MGIGFNKLFHSERVPLTPAEINVANKVASYNFLSTFSGTHFVAPRALQAKLGFSF